MHEQMVGLCCDAAAITAAGDHGSTFAGNPLVCHTACSVFDIIVDPAFLASVEAKGARLRAGGCTRQGRRVG